MSRFKRDAIRARQREDQARCMHDFIKPIPLAFIKLCRRCGMWKMFEPKDVEG